MSVQRKLILLCLIGICCGVSVNGQKETVSLAGNWRGVFSIKPGVEVPFNFIIREAGSSLKGFLVNGEERFPTGDLRFVGDSVFIPLPLFENELAFKLEGNLLNGFFRRQDLKGTATPVQAKKRNVISF